MISVKICGITRPEDAENAAFLGAAAIGFIFYEKSPRYIDPEHAAVLARSAGTDVKKVGVFVNAPQDVVNRAADTAGLDFVQLHGDESPTYTENISVPVIKAFRMSPDFNPAQVGTYNVRALLFDAFKKNEYGGTGETFDWKKTVIQRNGTPIILAGGITPENVNEAIKVFQPDAIDVSSGVETKPGIKDHTRLEALFRAIQNTKQKDNPFS